MKRGSATGHKAINPGLVNVTEYVPIYAAELRRVETKPALPSETSRRTLQQFHQEPGRGPRKVGIRLAP